jgi:hypothetical protein
MNTSKYITIIISCIIFPYIQTNAQTIKGKVVDSANKSIAYANIALLNKDSTFISGASTDSIGIFHITWAKDTKWIRVSCIGYNEYTLGVSQYKEYVGVITLSENSYVLQGVTIKRLRNPININEGVFSVKVAGGVLSKETDIMEILRKIPGLTVKDGKLTTLSGGTSIVYVNGRKLTDDSELKNIDIKNIKTIELDSNPNSKYDASADAVVKIITKSRLEGWSVEVDAGIKQNHRLGNDEGININYNHGGLNVFSSLGYGDYRKKTNQNISTNIITNDTVWNHKTNLYSSYSSTKDYDYSAGLDYNISNKQSIGLLYDGYHENMKDISPETTQTTANSNFYSMITGNSHLVNNSDNNHVNAYYSNEFNDKLSMDIYADYMHINSKRDQTTTEYVNNADNPSLTVSRNKSRYNMYAANPNFKYDVSGNSVNLGLEYSRVDGKNKLDYENTQMNGSNSKTEEVKYAGYLSYSYTHNNIQLQAGLRYEGVHSKFNDLIDASDDINRNYSNWFPSFSISYKSGEVSQSISYRSSINRPDFGKLNNYSYYINRFQYQEGNPNLQPEISNALQYNVMYKFMFLSLRYKYNKNFIGNYFYTLPSDSATYIGTWKNFNKQQQLHVIFNAQKRWNIYEPSITAMFMKNIITVPVLNGNERIDQPTWYVDINNYLHFPNDFLVDLEYNYTSKGTIQYFIFKPKHIFNMSVKRSFMKDNLSVNLSIKDIFRKDIDRYIGNIDNILFSQREDEDRRNISISIVWKFNNYKDNYRGDNAAKDVINRLQK